MRAECDGVAPRLLAIRCEAERRKTDAHMIKYLLTKLAQDKQENIWLSVMTHGPRANLEPNIFPPMPST